MPFIHPETNISSQFARIWRLLRLCHHLRNRHLQRSQECGLYSGAVLKGRGEVHCWSSKQDVAYGSRYTNHLIESCGCQSRSLRGRARDREVTHAVPVRRRIRRHARGHDTFGPASSVRQQTRPLQILLSTHLPTWLL